MVDFEDILKKLTARGVLLDHLGMIEDGKKWSVTLRKKGTTSTGYGVHKNIEKAVSLASGNMKDSFDPKTKPKRKRVRA